MDRLFVLCGAFALCSSAVPDAGAQPPGPPAAVAPLRLVTGQTSSPQDEALGRARLDVLMTRAGLPYTLTIEPMQRAAASLRAGLYDGDAGRVAGFDKELPGLIRVDPPWLVFEVRAYGKQALPADASWPALNGLQVAYVRGQRSVEYQLTTRDRTTAVSSTAACMGMAAAGRVDYCVVGSIGSAAVSAEQRTLHMHTLSELPLYLWLRAGYEAQASKLAAALQELSASSEWRQRPASAPSR